MSCLPTPTAPFYDISSPSQLAYPTPSTFVKRNGTRLELDGRPFIATGPNAYWLALDENVEPYPSIPSRGRVLEAMAIAQAMGATTIRAHTVGVNLGSAHAVENALGQFNDEAFAAVDWAIWAAKSYGLRLVVPLTDQYDYYHGGIPTFLRWRNLSATDFTPFYDLQSDVYNDFKTYVTTLLTHRSNITGLTMAEEPTILCFETGNELGGWGGKSSPPPRSWTSAVAALLKDLAPQTLVMSGSYGVRQDELTIQDVDIVSDHYYPTYSYNLKRSTTRAHTGGKAFIAGEYDWTDRYRHPFLYLTILVPALCAASLFLMPGRWWPWRISLRCCCRRRRRKKERYEVVPDDNKGLNDSTTSLDAAPLPVMAGASYPPSTPASSRTSLLDRSLLLRRWHFALFLLILCAPLGVIIHTFMPDPLHSFLSTMESLSAESKLAGGFYWSLFGKHDDCCRYVQHDDGYTLHYPSDASVDAGRGSGSRVAELTRSAWKIRGSSPPYLTTGSLDALSLSGLPGLPAVQCPQTALSVPSNTSSLRTSCCGISNAPNDNIADPLCERFQIPCLIEPASTSLP